MKKKTLIFISVLTVSLTTVLAQSPAPELDTVSDAIEQGDPAFRNLPAGDENKNEMKRIPSDEIPPAVRRRLESSAEYADWKNALIYTNKVKDEYLIEFNEADKTRSYLFKRDGRRIRKD